MGQRLNLEIQNGGIPLANSYYHWSAYTGSAIYIAKRVIELLDDVDFCKKYPDKRELAIRLLEATGAGVNEKERAEISKHPELATYEVKDCVDRNKGLLSITEAGMENTRSWEEGRVTIDLEDGMVYFDVFWMMTKEEYLESMGEDALEEYEALPVIDVDVYSDMDFDAFDAFEKLYEKTWRGNGFRLPNGDVVSWIE